MSRGVILDGGRLELAAVAVEIEDAGGAEKIGSDVGWGGRRLSRLGGGCGGFNGFDGIGSIGDIDG